MRVATLNEEASKNGYAVLGKKCKKLGLKPFLSKDHFFNFFDRIIDILYKQIEGRSVNANFLILPNEIDLEATGKESSWWAVSYTPIKERVPLDFNALKKWLPIFEDDQSFLVVKLDEHEFLLNGFMFLGQKVENIIHDMAPWSHDPWETLFKKSLSVSLNNQSVTMKIGKEPFLILRQGEILDIPDYQSMSRGAIGSCSSFQRETTKFVEKINDELMMWKKMYPDSAEEQFTPMNFNDIISEVVEAVERIISLMVDFQHGGTLVFGVRSGELDPSCFQPGFIECNLPLGMTILRKINVFRVESYRCQGSDDEYHQDRDEVSFPKLIQALVKGIANLSKTDGAVILDDSMNVVAAGTFLKVTETASNVGGARMKSAESFVNANPDTFSIVVSQDGKVTAVSPKKNS